MLALTESFQSSAGQGCIEEHPSDGHRWLCVLCRTYDVQMVLTLQELDAYSGFDSL